MARYAVTRRSYPARPSTYSRAAASRRAASVAARRYPPPSRTITGELKSVDVNTTVGFLDSGQVTLCNGLARGDDIGDRDGRRIYIRSIEAECMLPAHTVQGFFRFMVVYDKEANGSAFGLTDLLEYAGAGVPAAPASPIKLSNRARFIVLYDSGARPMDDASLRDAGTVFRYKRSGLMMPVTYNSGNAGTIADIQSGALCTVCCSSLPAASGFTAGQLNVRVRFTE